jgi:hypothetical protein
MLKGEQMVQEGALTTLASFNLSLRSLCLFNMPPPSFELGSEFHLVSRYAPSFAIVSSFRLAFSPLISPALFTRVALS